VAISLPFLLFINCSRAVTSITSIAGELPKRAAAEAISQTTQKIGE
jgi:hypothetical protein